MSDFDIDNTGSGFSIDDNEDLDSLLKQAEDAAIDEEDTSRLFEEGYEGDAVTKKKGRASSRKNKAAKEKEETSEASEPVIVGEPATVEPVVTDELFVDEDDSDFMKMFDDSEGPDETIAVSEEVAPDAAEQTVTEISVDDNADEVVVTVEEMPTVEKQVNESSYPHRIRIPTEADDLENVTKVIRVLDAYRALNTEEKSVSGQFITNGDIVEDEATYVVKVLNVDPMLSKTMKALSEAKGHDPVERAFYAIDLDDNLLYSVGQLVTVFTGEDLDRNKPRSQYARTIVKNIDELDTKAMGFVKATESVLRALEG